MATAKILLEFTRQTSFSKWLGGSVLLFGALAPWTNKEIGRNGFPLLFTSYFFFFLRIRPFCGCMWRHPQQPVSNTPFFSFYKFGIFFCLYVWRNLLTKGRNFSFSNSRVYRLPKGFRVDRRGKKSNKRYTVQNGRMIDICIQIWVTLLRGLNYIVPRARNFVYF
jgi:hypothetical protein